MPIDERLERVENFGAARQWRGDRCGDQAHAALWQIRHARTNAPRDCSNAGVTPALARRRHQTFGKAPARPLAQEALRRVTSPCRRRPSCTRSGISCAPCREVPWRRLPSSIRARRRCAASRPSFPPAPWFRSWSPRSWPDAVVCADAAPISRREATAVAVAREEILVMGHLGLKRRAQPSRCDAEPRMNER